MSMRRLLAATAIATVAGATALGAGAALSSRSDASQPPARAAAAAAAAATTPSAHLAVASSPRVSSGTRLLGPGDRGPRVRDLQARLKQIAWFNADVTGTYGPITTAAVRGFQGKRGFRVTGVVDRRTLTRLHSMTRKPTRAELHNRTNTPGALDRRCRTGRVLCVDKRSRTLRFLVDGRVRQTLDVRFGAASTPTREGVFHVYLKDRDHVSRLYGSSMPFSMFFSGGQAVHYSSDFAAVGYAGASHGCVNVRDYDGVKRLYDRVRVGDKVVVYWS